MIRAIVVDDEPLGRRKLVDLLKPYAEVELVAVCSGGAEAIAAIERESPHLLFLDIQMPEIDGFEVLQSIRAERVPEVIFVTAHDRFAIRAFEVHALDYLLKPFSRERFQTAIERAMERIGRGSAGADGRVVALLEELRRTHKPLERIPVTVGTRTQFVNLRDIDRIESEGNYLRLHGAGSSHLVRGTLKTLEEKLDRERFVRVNRSSIVNLSRVARIEAVGSGNYAVVMTDGSRLLTGPLYGRRLRALLENPL